MNILIKEADKSYPKLKESRRYIALFVDRSTGVVIVNKCLNELPAIGLIEEVPESHLHDYKDFHGEIVFSQ